jgi:alkanesulfonate monooxygenase SsuD/methylene tetrahydromethanopterin reductase-like flavin-dependent oxidoreductase (luciferase family)
VQHFCTDRNERTGHTLLEQARRAGGSADDATTARDESLLETQWPFYKEQFEWAARERGWRPPTYEQFLAEVDHGSMYVGSSETVANRITTVVRTLSLSRFDLLYALGRVPHDQRMATIELYGREVIPRVRELLAAAPEEDAAQTTAVRS